MAFENHELALSTYNDGFEKMSYISLELDAINCLEESIRCHETRPAENANHVSDRKFLREIELSERDNLSKQDSTRKSQPQKVNAGYILFDGSEIQYISTDKTGEPMVSKPPEKFSSDGSFHSRTSESSTRISELASHLTLSSNELFVRDSFRDTISRLSLTPYKRLPTNVHFSMLQKFYLLATGAAPVLTINTFYLSVAFLQPVLGNQVLSAIGTCHYIPLLAAMLLIFCGKKHWVPFFPTVPVCLVLMMVCVAVVPSFVAAGRTLSVFAIYSVVTLNGFCAGLSQSLLSRMIVLFPGGKSSSLIRHGECVGTLFPVVLQMILILATGVNSTEKELPQNNTMSLYVLFGAAFLGILLGLISLIKLSRSGIYELFAGRDCAAHSPKNITLGSVPATAKRRYHAIKWCLFAEISLSLVSYFVLSLVPYVHEATFQSSSSSSVTFWKGYLATVLVSVFRVGDFLGGLLSHVCCREQRSDINVATFGYLSACILRLGFVFAAVLFTRTPFLLYHNLFMMAFYFMLAFTNGSLSVSMTLGCQSFMTGRRQDSCPIVSQFLWSSGVLGATVGVTLSFIQITI